MEICSSRVANNPRAFIRRLYRDFATEQRTRIAFKGGNIEKSFLLDLHISYLDLERYGCPKFDDLRAIMPADEELTEGCDCHSMPSKHHCAMMECQAFMRWYKDMMNHVQTSFILVINSCKQNKVNKVTRLITVGAKVFSFQSDRLTFKHSLCFLFFPLAAFPATFGLTELHKGYFPHLFNTLTNQDYEGPLPDTRFYDPDRMPPKKKTDFLQWHASKVATHYTFNLKEDMEKYCESDVKLLKAGCQAFTAQFEEEAGFNPLTKCLGLQPLLEEKTPRPQNSCCRTAQRVERFSNQPILQRPSMVNLAKLPPHCRRLSCLRRPHPPRPQWW